MKQKPVLKILSVLLMGALLGWGASAVGAEGLCKPFVTLGYGLRELSLRSGGGNVAAWLLTGILSALPLLCLVKKNGTLGKKDLLLPIASMEIFAMIYFLVNPTRISAGLLWIGQEGLMFHWALTCMGVLAATIFAWLILTYLDTVEGKAGQLFPKLLMACSFLLAFAGGFQGVRELLTEIAAVKAGNTDVQTVKIAGLLKGMILVIRLIPTILSSRVLLWGRDLACAVDTEPFGEETVSLAESIASRCKGVVKITVLCALTANVVQLLCLPVLMDIQIRVELPLAALALSSGLILLCGYFRRAKELHDDNVTII